MNPPPPVTFTGLPEAHGGDDLTVTLTYNTDDHPTSYTQVPGRVTVSGGQIADVRRAVRTGPDRNKAWVLRIEPDGTDDVTITAGGVSATVPHTAQPQTALQGKGVTEHRGFDPPDPDDLVIIHDNDLPRLSDPGGREFWTPVLTVTDHTYNSDGTPRSAKVSIDFGGGTWEQVFGASHPTYWGLGDCPWDVYDAHGNRLNVIGHSTNRSCQRGHFWLPSGGYDGAFTQDGRTRQVKWQNDTVYAISLYLNFTSSCCVAWDQADNSGFYGEQINDPLGFFSPDSDQVRFGWGDWDRELDPVGRAERTHLAAHPDTPTATRSLPTSHTNGLRYTITGTNANDRTRISETLPSGYWLDYFSNLTDGMEGYSDKLGEHCNGERWIFDPEEDSDGVWEIELDLYQCSSDAPSGEFTGTVYDSVSGATVRSNTTSGDTASTR